MPNVLLDERPGRKLTLLQNGVKVATWEDETFGNNIFYGIGMPFGANIEPAMKEGLAHYVEHALVCKAFVAALTNTGGGFNARTGVKHTEFFGATGADDFGGIFWQQAQTLHQPNFGPVHLQHEKKRVLAEIKERPYLNQVMMLQLAMIGDHPDRRNVLGLPSVVERLTEQDVRAHWQCMFQPQHLTVAMSGKIKHADAVALAESCFGGMPVGQSPVIPPAAFTPHIHSDMPDIQRTHMTAIFKSLAHTHPLTANAPLLAHFIVEQQDLSLEYDLTHRRGLVYSSWAEMGGTNSYKTLGLGCDFDAPVAEQIAESVLAHTHGMPDRIRQAHLDHARKRMSFLAGCEERSLSIYRNELLEAALHNKLPRTRLEQFNETRMPTLVQARDIAAETFRTNPPALAVSGAGAMPVINRLRL